MGRPKSLSEDQLHKLMGVGPRLEAIGADAQPILTIESLHDLLQVVGYLKYMKATGAVMLRGQTSIYATLDPSLYRGSGVNRRKRDTVVGKFVQESSHWTCAHIGHATALCPEKLVSVPSGQHGLLASGTPRYAAEGLLQHYGLRTRWLDVVDNIWVALWFACHDFVRAERFVHVVRRVQTSDEDYAYLVAVIVEGPLKETAAGLFTSDGEAHLLDLRRAVPSFYLRPHAQHGWLVRPWENNPDRLTVVNMRVDLRIALEWLGSGVLLSAFGLYPPASVDVGYRTLLSSADRVGVPSVLGSIDIAGPGY